MPSTLSVSVTVMPQLNAIGIVASDLERIDPLLPAPRASTSRRRPRDGHIDTFLPNGVRLMLDREDVVAELPPGLDSARRATRSSLAFECASPAEVDEIYARAVDAGFHGEKEPWDAFWGQRYAQLQDPDGVGVDLYAAL